MTWTKIPKTMSQNEFFLHLSWLCQAFYQSDRKLTNTQVQDNRQAFSKKVKSRANWIKLRAGFKAEFVIQQCFPMADFSYSVIALEAQIQVPYDQPCSIWLLSMKKWSTKELHLKWSGWGHDWNSGSLKADHTHVITILYSFMQWSEKRVEFLVQAV